MTEKEDIKDGLVEEFYDNGQLRYRTNYKNGQQEGLREEFRQNGQLEKKQNYKNGKRDGHWEEFHENGPLKSRGKFINGKLDGLWEEFHENGQLKSRGNFIKGLAEGLWERYHENGQLISAKYMCEWSEREERINEYLWSEDILIPNIEIISHRKPVATSEGTKDGFIHLLYKYPIFPKRNKEEIELSKEALVRCQDFINYDEFMGRSMKMPNILGVIKKHKDIYKYEYKDDLLDLDILNDLFENNDSLYQDPIYQYEGWIDNSNWGYKDEGIEFKWHYPWFFHISDEGLKNCAQEVWGDFLSNYSAYF